MKKIAVIPGDGVGPEVVRESQRVLEHIASLDPAIELALRRVPLERRVVPEIGRDDAAGRARRR